MEAVGWPEMQELGPGLWRFAARHPEWHPRGFGDEVAGYALRDEDGLMLVDPLVGDRADLEALDALADGPVTIFVTIPYHARSAGELAAHWNGVTVLGHPAVEAKLPAGTPFRAIAPGEPLPHGVQAFAIGSPRRRELPLHLPRARALAFGDAVVGAEGGLRVWVQGERSEGWYRDRLRPTLEPLAALAVERVLATHGSPVLRDGARELRAALDAGPWAPPRG
jgi:glyoxylase-like metal-dependent hydrolase (beta-lactamase superfamily II)